MARNMAKLLEGANGSSTNVAETILETFVPGYSLVSRFLQDTCGFDISTLVSVAAIIIGCISGFQFLARRFGGIFAHYFTANITIDSDDEIYYYITSWIAEVEALKKVQHLQAQSDHSGADALVNEDDNLAADEDELFNFSNWESRVPPKYMPAIGAHWFWYKGSFFKFERRRDPAMKDGFFGDKVLGQEKSINITVLGWSTEPAKRLLIEARNKSLSQESTKTVVRRPSPKETRGRGRQAWMRVAMRPSRPMETVVLDTTEKSLVLRDINEFVHPATVQWYANRGIPYRRGYLFHGPPGTGKTSLSFAIAGVFGFDVYCISLLEPTLTEEDLSILFNNLPSRCVVLLEDIDAAGLHRKKDEEEEDSKQKKKKRGAGDKEEKEDSSTLIAMEVAKAFKNVNDEAARNRTGRGANNEQGISLSGLLNAIDGVASPEGRILVMTTNFPEKLDEALIRPGRIDMKIAFTLATKQQIRELFLRMYTTDKPISKRKKPTKVTEVVAPAAYEEDFTVPHGQVSSEEKLEQPMLLPGSKSQAFDRSVLFELADQFASHLPGDTFSPAEIQGFLLTRKKDPNRAVHEVAKWRDETLESKKKGTEKSVDAGVKAATEEEEEKTDADGKVEDKADDQVESKADDAVKDDAKSNGHTTSGDENAKVQVTETNGHADSTEMETVNGKYEKKQDLVTNGDHNKPVTNGYASEVLDEN